MKRIYLWNEKKNDWTGGVILMLFVRYLNTHTNTWTTLNDINLLLFLQNIISSTVHTRWWWFRSFIFLKRRRNMISDTTYSSNKSNMHIFRTQCTNGNKWTSECIFMIIYNVFRLLLWEERWKRGERTGQYTQNYNNNKVPSLVNILPILLISYVFIYKMHSDRDMDTGHIFSIKIYWSQRSWRELFFRYMFVLSQMFMYTKVHSHCSFEFFVYLYIYRAATEVQAVLSSETGVQTKFSLQTTSHPHTPIQTFPLTSV